MSISQQFKISVFEAIFDRLHNTFVLADDYIGAYQIGRSVSSPGDSRDFDLLIIRGNAYESPHIQKLDILYNHMSSGEPFKGAFDASDFVTRKRISKVASEVSVEQGTEVVVKYRVGPIRMDDNTLYVHVCGPLTLIEALHFCKLFPFHGLSFLVQNRPIVGSSLSEMLSVPFPSYEQYRKWITLLYERGVNSSSEEHRMKCTRKILLCKNLFQKRNNPYRRVDRMIARRLSLLKADSQLNDAKALLKWSFELSKDKCSNII